MSCIAIYYCVLCNFDIKLKRVIYDSISRIGKLYVHITESKTISNHNIMKNLLILVLVFCSLISSKNQVYSQDTDDQTCDLNSWIDSQFTKGMDSFNIAGATIVLMQGDSILHINGYGLADIESNIPVNSYSSIFGIASISKTFVATAIMQLYEDGRLELDRDVNNYLKTFQLKYKFNDSVTIENLLTHTAGFDERNIGTAVRTEKDVISLAQYLKKRMPPQIRPAGKVITYSNHGYALLGLIVEEVSGLSFDEYVRKMILKPLEMNYSGYKRQAELEKNYVTSYLQTNNQLIPYKPDFQLVYPAGSLSTTASDMGHYISMFLRNGNYKGIQILDSATVVKMHQTGFKQYEKSINGWLLGFYEGDWHKIRLIMHGGDIQGFASELILIPEKNTGLFLCVNSSSIQNSKSRIFIGNFINGLLLRLMPDSIVENEKSKVSPEIGSVDEPLEKFTGTYRYTRYAYTTIDKLAILIGFAPEIEIVTKDNTLEVLQRNDKLVPISNLRFYSKKYDKYVAFGRGTKGEISYFFGDYNSYVKLRWYEPIKFQIFWVGSITLILLIYIFASIVSKLFGLKKKIHLIKKVNFSLASIIIVFIAVFALVFMNTDPQEFFYGMPLSIKIALVLPFLIILLDFISLYLLTKAFRYKELGTLDLIYQSIFTVSALFFIPWLMYYNLIGFNF
jgi:CubicO group peptidase (beta-lactamase class C family)